jgi:hypothetical protein
VDPSRIKDVGPDRAAAEWLLRCGAAVKWKDHESKLVDYNSLPVGSYRTLFIKEIDATDSCSMSVGFPHLSKQKQYLHIFVHLIYSILFQYTRRFAAFEKISIAQMQLPGQ